MTGSTLSLPFTATLDRVLGLIEEHPRPVILVDGRAGAGKTTLGGAIAAALPGAQLIHMDDIYPDWTGLDEGSRHLAAFAFDSTAPRWQRWSWDTLGPAEWHSLDPARPLVVEGIGALSRASAPHATLRINVVLDDAERKRRALERDGERFAVQWEVWAAQEEIFLAEEDPASLADITVDSWSWDPSRPVA